MSKKEKRNTTVAELIEQGRMTGKLTSEEIEMFLDNAQLSEDEVEKLYEHIEQAEIEIIQPTETLGEESIENFGKNLESEDYKLEDSVKAYLKEIGKYNLLSSDKETECAIRIKNGTDAEEKLRNGEYVDEEERKTLSHRVFVGDAAKNRMTNSNLRLVVSIARRYINRGLDFLDLIQEGSIGLIKAVEKYDYQKGYRFSTYATWWIKQAITRAISDKGNGIRIPVHMHETISRVKREREAYYHQQGVYPTVKELAAILDMTPSQVTKILNYSQSPVSLDEPVGEEEDSSLADFVPSANPTPETLVERIQLKKSIRDALGTLTDREALVLTLRYGLDDGVERTLEEVGKELAVTRERVRQIEAKALRKLHHPSRGNRLKAFTDNQ